MKELIKTIAFLVVGLVLGLSAWALNYMSKPKAIAQFESVGEEFFPEFGSPDEAKYLEVAAYDEAASKATTFRVEFKDGLWRIPSHYDYPAEAKDRLVKTATSVIGIRREALAGRRENEHQRFGVIDPLAEDITDPAAVGKRITLGGSDDEPLADYIVGKQVEEESLNDEQLREIRGQAAKQPMFYVRRPDEVETYMSTLNLDVSTKFSDWIEPDLLKLEASNLRQLVIDKYTVEHREEEIRRGPLVMLASRPVKVEEEVNKLTRENGFGPWKLDGLNEETEEVDSSKISTLTSSLDNLEILGVRPRFEIDGQPLLTADLQLQIPPSMRSDRNAIEAAIDQVQSDLASKGFAIDVDQSGDEPKARLLSDKGELTCASNEGVVYHLHFGNVFLGSDSEIEIGGNEEKAAAEGDDTGKSDDTDSKAGEGDDKESAKSSDDSSADKDAKNERNDKQDKKDSSSEKKNRYLLVRVEFDPSLVEGKPFKPIKPVEPKKAEPTTEKPSTDESNNEEKPEETKPDESKPDDDASKKDADKKDADETEKKSTEEKSGDEADDSGKADDEKAENVKLEDKESSCFGLNQDEADNAQNKDDGESKEADSNDEKKPAEPEKSEPDDPATDDDAKKSDDAKKPEDDTKTGDEPDSQKPEVKPDPEAEYQRALLSYQFALQQYEEDEKQYEQDVKAYEKKLKQGQKKVDELNERFAAWYYVISAANLENLRLSRADLVKEKPKPEKTPGETEEPGTSEEPGTKEVPETTEEPSKEGDAQPPQDSEKKDGDKTEDDQPAKKEDAEKGQGGDEKKVDENASDTPSDETKDEPANQD